LIPCVHVVCVCVCVCVCVYLCVCLLMIACIAGPTTESKSRRPTKGRRRRAAVEDDEDDSGYHTGDESAALAAASQRLAEVSVVSYNLPHVISLGVRLGVGPGAGPLELRSNAAGRRRWRSRRPGRERTE
jgi:hypothetical protein